MSKAILIDSANRTVREVTVAGLKDMQRCVGGYIQIAHEWESGDALYVDEEGLLKAQEHWFRISGQHSDHPMAGNGLIVGSDDEGENADVVLTVADVVPLVTFYDRTQVEAWAKGNASEPAITISSIDDDGAIQDETVIARYGVIISGMPKE